MTIELGISTFGETTLLESTGKAISHDQRIRDLVEEIELADQVGLDIYAIGEHHREDFAVSAPEIVLAAGAVNTKKIRLSSAVTILSSIDPVRPLPPLHRHPGPVAHKLVVPGEGVKYLITTLFYLFLFK